MSPLPLIVVLLSTAALQAQDAPDPEAHFDRVMSNPHLHKSAGQITGEQFCWHAASAADDFVDAYLAWGDAAWLARGADYFDWLVSRMATGPDGYKGWIGPYIYDGQYWCDVHVGDAILVNPMLRFAEVVLADSALAAAFGARARSYVALAQRDLIEKWDRRGTWRDDGPQGAYVSWDRYLAPNDFTTWRDYDEPKAGLSLPFNKQMDMGVAALRLYRITGAARYRERAERVFRQFKSRLRLFAGGYVWNYWEPLGPWDVGQQRIRHWVNVHPTRNYQGREVAFVAEAYHTGVIFSRGDIEYIVRTNLGNMWDGDLDNPRWRNAGSGGDWAPQERHRAGALWPALVDFDGRARALYARGLKPGTIPHAYFQRRVRQRPPGFDRHYADTGPRQSARALPPTQYLTMAAALPRVITRGQRALLICKAARADSLSVDLHDENGRYLETLYAGPIDGGDDGLAGLFWLDWDGAGRPAGAYAIRWTLGGEYREYAIELR